MRYPTPSASTSIIRISAEGYIDFRDVLYFGSAVSIFFLMTQTAPRQQKMVNEVSISSGFERNRRRAMLRLLLWCSSSILLNVVLSTVSPPRLTPGKTLQPQHTHQELLEETESDIVFVTIYLAGDLTPNSAATADRHSGDVKQFRHHG